MNSIKIWMWLCCLLVPWVGRAGEAVDLTAEIQFQGSWTVHCVVETNSWFMEQHEAGWTNRCWFTGTNLGVENLPDNKAAGGGIRNQANSRAYETIDGNPARPDRVPEILSAVQKIAWLAFCSGHALKRHGREIPLPGDSWKGTVLASNQFTDRTTVFKDGLGLPKSIDVFLRNNPKERIFHYQALKPEKVLGWSFPSEFSLVQYKAAGSKGLAEELTARGRIISCGPGTMPALPPAGFSPDSSNRYVVFAGGCYVGITNAPNSTPVRISFKAWEHDDNDGTLATFILNNDELRSILIWNYRIQVLWPGSGKDTPEWETIHDDYPGWGQVGRLAALMSDKILISPPSRAPWRFCILYSRGTVPGNQPGSYGGDYEVISPVMKELQPPDN